jgi:flagellar hook-associated protein FlgK
MNGAMSIAQSGLKAAQLRLDAAASNVANLQTADYRRREVVATEQPPDGNGVGGGVQAEVRRLDRVGADLAADFVAQKTAVLAYSANLRVISSSARMLGSLLDERA